MIIESISNDRAILFDEAEKRKIEVKLIRNAEQSFIRFNPVEKLYEIHISNEDQLLHEAHHLFKPCMRPIWLAPISNFEVSDIEETLQKISVDEKIFKEIKNAILYFSSYFLKSLKKSPNSERLSNIFEDLAVEKHLHLNHGLESKHEIYRKSLEYVERCAELMYVDMSVKENRETFLSHNPFTQLPLCELCYLILDEKLAKSQNLDFVEYYDQYLGILKTKSSLCSCEDFAMQYRIELEIDRVQRIRLEKDWKKAGDSIISRYIQGFSDLFRKVLLYGSKTTQPQYEVGIIFE